MLKLIVLIVIPLVIMIGCFTGAHYSCEVSGGRFVAIGPYFGCIYR